MIKRLTLLTIVGLIVGLVYAGEVIERTHTVYLTTVDTGGSESVRHDTIKNLVGLVHSDHNMYPEIIRIILKPSATTAHGMGLSDSGYLWLYTVFADEYHLLGCDTQAALPCTLRLPYAGPPADSLFKEKLALEYRIVDTLSDFSQRAEYDIDINYILGEK